jgi:hypothetical protein
MSGDHHVSIVVAARLDHARNYYRGFLLEQAGVMSAFDRIGAHP